VEGLNEATAPTPALDRQMIRIEAGSGLFNLRIAGLAFRDGHVLVHRATHETFWTFPGGRAEIGETSAETLAREMAEELRVTARIGRLLWLVENFFRYDGRDYHELGFYYHMELPQDFPFIAGEIVHRIADGANQLEFKWVPAAPDALAALPLLPDFISRRILTLPDATEVLVHRDTVPA
jgi:8-oxo-dGTP pyrophosphatase MutT (NUDIX family)